MTVNQELLENIQKFIIKTKKNSTIIIVTFHSLEDLLVKKISNFCKKNFNF